MGREMKVRRQKWEKMNKNKMLELPKSTVSYHWPMHSCFHLQTPRCCRSDISDKNDGEWQGRRSSYNRNGESMIWECQENYWLCWWWAIWLCICCGRNACRVILFVCPLACTSFGKSHICSWKKTKRVILNDSNIPLMIQYRESTKM